ncbi:hypothetical protein L249_1752 [Ophiocordyceps polyrhachis-furcata BCC 54312]|uniref:Glycosyl hydrolase family 88 n=1 Tax=Ophiocordyceps polyrhachis-furcata BCC 54312 TaxID=1330021 RepID=A0A367LRH1_9HYPO|nr:hypothetical protein L249_1752 [Ophiocordyceps polyrhachis-furcata BCC 54312]
MKLIITILIFTSVVTAATPLSRLMLDSLKTRLQGIASSGASSSTLESAVLAQAIQALMAQYPPSPPGSGRDNDDYFLGAVLDLASLPFTDADRAKDRPLDRFALATAIDRAIRSGRTPVSPAALTATRAIAASLPLQARNPDGGLWYYHAYPQWSYLDGIFAVLPFMAESPGRNESDMELQLALLQKHCDIPSARPMLVHGYDWSRTAPWADVRNGASTHVWGRSLGWLLVGAIETWELLGCVPGDASRPLCLRLPSLARKIADSLVSFVDPETGVWRQLTILSPHYGNYLESSSTALFIFALLKALRLRMLLSGPPYYRKVARRAYNYIVDCFVTRHPTNNGTIGYDRTVSVCSLNSTASFDYYVSRPIAANSLLGESAFILASLEMERDTRD